MMDEFASKQKRVETLLDKDATKIKELSRELDRSNQLTEQMVTILQSFQGRLNKLDKTIIPVYRQTQHLTRLQENIDRTLVELDRVIGFHQVTDEVEPRIKEGPQDGNIEGYLKLMERLRVAVDFFNHNNPGSVELGHVNLCFDMGLDKLEKEFRDQLRDKSKPVPLQVLDKLAAPQEEGTEVVKVILDHIPDAVVTNLKVIANYLLIRCGSMSRTDILVVYSQVRSTNTLGRSLLNVLKDSGHQGAALMPGMLGRGQLSYQMLRESPVKKKEERGKKREAHMAARREIVRGTMSTSSLLAGESGVSADDLLKGSSTLLTSAKVLLKLMESEWTLMERIIPSDRHSHVFADLTNAPIDLFMHESEALLQRAQHKLSRHVYTTIVPCLKIIKNLNDLMPGFNALLHGLEGKRYERFPNLVFAFEKLALKGALEYITYIKGDSEKQSNLPKDGTVHELTSSSMWLMEQLLEFTDTVGRLLLSEGRYNINEDEESRRRAVGSYLFQVIDALSLNMEMKSRTYESPVLAALFLMNNFHFIKSSFMRNQQMLTLLTLYRSDIEDQYNDRIDRESVNYQRGFSKLLSYLGIIHVHTPLTKQERQALKDKFKGFNTELEDLFRTQQQYSIPDPRLRRFVREELIRMIVTPYDEFYTRYAHSGFTKNDDKYLKFDSDRVEEKLNLFFNNGAP